MLVANIMRERSETDDSRLLLQPSLHQLRYTHLETFQDCFRHFPRPFQPVANRKRERLDERTPI